MKIALSWLEHTFTRFHSVVKSLEKRSHGRPLLKINNEYDVQYLVKALLHIRFNDVREEEHAPSFGTSTTRIDFILKEEEIVIETKMTRDGLDDKVLLKQLIEDIMFYQEHPDCKTILFIVYDPKERIKNPHAILGDLGKRNFGNLKVLLIISPLKR